MNFNSNTDISKKITFQLRFKNRLYLFYNTKNIYIRSLVFCLIFSLAEWLFPHVFNKKKNNPSRGSSDREA